MIAASGKEQVLSGCALSRVSRGGNEGDGLEGGIVWQRFLEVVKHGLDIDEDYLLDDDVWPSNLVSKLHHEQPLCHLADIKPINAALWAIGQLGVVDIDIAQFSHTKVLPVEVLQLCQYLFTLFLAVDLIEEDSSFGGLAIWICFSVDEHEQLIGGLESEQVGCL
jgi:hypothetical protein